MSSRRWFVWHSWLGVAAGLLLFLICWSGSVAVFSEEIDWLLNSAERVEPAGEFRSWGEWQAAVERAYPGTRVDSIVAPTTRRSAAEILLETPDGRWLRTYVDPFTARVTGQTSYFNVQRFFRSLHMCLFDLGGTGAGYYLVTAFSLVLIGSLATSLLFYKRWWQRFFAWKAHSTRRAFWSEAHKLTGLWSLWFIALIAITGIWYLLEFADLGFAYPQLEPVASTETRTHVTTDELVARAHSVWPKLELTHMYAPGGYYGPVAVFHGENESNLVRSEANVLVLSANDATPMLMRSATDLGWPARWVDTADPLHFGNFGGLVSKTAWFLFGLFLSALCLTGAYLHVQRQGRRPELGRRVPVAMAYSISGLVLVLATIGAVQEIQSYGSPSPPTGVWIFIAVWTVATASILIIWARKVR